MKKIVASVSMLAFGATALSAAQVIDDPAKPWNVSLTLRAFYDDNVNTAPVNEHDTFGFEVSPSAGYVFQLERTAITVGYTYSLKWYDEPPPGQSDDFDNTHNFNFTLDHAISSRYALSIRDNFVIGQEPDQLRATETIGVFQRIDGNNIRNYGSISLSAQLSPLFGLEGGYENAFFDYDNEGFDEVNNAPSFSGLLDRVEHIPHLDARWQIAPTTVGLLGYKFRQILYTADEQIDDALNPDTGEPYMSDVRDIRYHYAYLGGEHNFRPDLTASLRAGASFSDQYNNPDDSSDIAPYVRATMTYNYLPDSALDLGFSYDRSSTDIFNPDDEGDFTQDAQTGVFWTSVRHKITPKFYANLTGQIQNSIYNGGEFDDDNEWFFLFGINFEYQFSRHFAAHIGYNYDRLDTDDTGREFDRNRVYIGVTAGY